MLHAFEQGTCRYRAAEFIMNSGKPVSAKEIETHVYGNSSAPGRARDLVHALMIKGFPIKRTKVNRFSEFEYDPAMPKPAVKKSVKMLRPDDKIKFTSKQTGLSEVFLRKDILSFSPFPDFCDIKISGGKTVRVANFYSTEVGNMKSVQTLMGF